MLRGQARPPHSGPVVVVLHDAPLQLEATGGRLVRCRPRIQPDLFGVWRRDAASRQGAIVSAAWLRARGPRRSERGTRALSARNLGDAGRGGFRAVSGPAKRQTPRREARTLDCPKFLGSSKARTSGRVNVYGPESRTAPTATARCLVGSPGSAGLVVGLMGIACAAAGLRLGVASNVSRSAPRGIYRTVADAPARGALVVACLPLLSELRTRSRLPPRGCCPGGGAARPQAVVRAVAGDRVELGATA